MISIQPAHVMFAKKSDHSGVLTDEGMVVE